MKPTWIIHQGEALTVLQSMPSESVSCVVTSPPYWGLRDYGTGRWDGGESDCEHGLRRVSSGNKGHVDQLLHGERDVCYKCGARRVDIQIGLEKTPEEYVAKLVEIFREVRRVLRNDGTLWLNLGDSYCGYKGENYLTDKSRSKLQSKTTVPSAHHIGTPQTSGVKSKDLVGIPWLVAFALRADGWYLRSDIIWSKPNSMPESVTDRPTKSHEYIFLLAKSQKYYYDADAIREPHKAESLARMKSPLGAMRDRFNQDEPKPGNFDNYLERDAGWGNPEGRNCRSVWTVNTHGFADAHFATFPPKLIQPCILAGAPVGGVVLDPFAGSGTTGVIATQLERNFIGIELKPEYVAMSEKRIESVNQQYGLFQ